LRTMKPARASGEAAFIDCGNEGSQLIQGDTIKHFIALYI